MRGIAKNDTIYTPCDGVIISLRKGQAIDVDESIPGKYWMIVSDSCRVETSRRDLESKFLIF